jgi:hypothetical protein
VELAGKVKEFEAQGLGVAAITYDRPEALRHFAERTGIAYPLLSDDGSKVIRAFGILNETVPQDNFAYGIPYPGVYVIDPSGRVKSKYFEDRFQERFAAGSILVKEFPGVGGTEGKAIETRHLKLRTWISDDAVVPDSRVSLVLEVELPARMHVYAPGVQGYIPVRLSIDESTGWKLHSIDWPPSRMLHLPAINETVPVFEGRFRVLRDVTLAGQNVVTPMLNPDRELTLKGSFRYQACDDKVCYPPQDVPLEWTIRVQPHDRTRVPEEMQRR